MPGRTGLQQNNQNKQNENTNSNPDAGRVRRLAAGRDANLPAQDARFFRISGPAATTITAFRPDGTLVWSNALAGTNYTVQTCLSLPGGTNWVDYVQLPVTNGVNTNQIIDLNPPSGMALIPAGSFTMGDNLDGELAMPPFTRFMSRRFTWTSLT